MKKTIALLAFCAIADLLMAQKLSVPDVEVVAGGTASFTLTVDTEELTCQGFQFEMQFPETGFTLKDASASAGWQGGTLATGTLVDGYARGAAFSLSDAAIPAGQQEIGQVAFTADTDLAIGSYSVTISNFELLDGLNYFPVPDVTFTVRVVERLSVVLDENATTAPAEADNVDVLVKRPVKAGQWTPICLPFAMNEEQVREAFGDGALVARFSKCETVSDRMWLGLNFSYTGYMEANQPYLLKVQADVPSFSVANVDIRPASAPATVVGAKAGADGTQVFNQFVGTYVSGSPLPADALLLEDGQFAYAGADATVKAFHAYFSLYDVLLYKEDAAGSIVLLFSDVSTGVSALSSGDAGDYYDLNGRRVSRSQTGVLIRDGRKTAVRKPKSH